MIAFRRSKALSDKGMAMQHGIFLFAVILVFSCVQGAVAKDLEEGSFGAPFYNQTPAGMAEYTMDDAADQDIAMDDAAADLQNIIPAAGDEDADDASGDAVNASPDVTDQP